ncbi:MAG: hypothetical protein K6F93_03395, partial [Lachnospiraceae bacterium]|nr:hypothetical protein [Lachnospiraceae bacterium]
WPKMTSVPEVVVGTIDLRDPQSSYELRRTAKYLKDAKYDNLNGEEFNEKANKLADMIENKETDFEGLVGKALSISFDYDYLSTTIDYVYDDGDVLDGKIMIRTGDNFYTMRKLITKIEGNDTEIWVKGVDSEIVESAITATGFDPRNNIRIRTASTYADAYELSNGKKLIIEGKTAIFFDSFEEFKSFYSVENIDKLASAVSGDNRSSFISKIDFSQNEHGATTDYIDNSDTYILHHKDAEGNTLFSITYFPETHSIVKLDLK